MPVHVENHHVEGDVVGVDIGDQIPEIVGGIALVFAVPIAEHVAGRHGLTAGNLHIVGKRILVVVAVAEEIHVDGIGVDGLLYPRYAVDSLAEGKRSAVVATLGRGRLVDNGPAVAREQSVLEVRTMAVADVAVECAHGALQVEGVVLARIPEHGAAVQVERDAERSVGVLRRSNSGTNPVFQIQRTGGNVEVAVALLFGELGHRQPTVDHGKRGAVLKQRRSAYLCWGVAVLYAYQSRREYGKPHIARLHHGSLIGNGVVLRRNIKSK